MRVVGALIIFFVIGAAMIPLTIMLWKDRPKRGDNWQDGGGGADGLSGG
jgi:hypothetical protein